MGWIMKTKTISFRVSSEEYEKIESISRIACIQKSELIRRKMLSLLTVDALNYQIKFHVQAVLSSVYRWTDLKDPLTAEQKRDLRKIIRSLLIELEKNDIQKN